MTRAEGDRASIRKYLLNRLGVTKVQVTGDYETGFFVELEHHGYYTERDYINSCYRNLGLYLTPKSVQALTKPDKKKVKY